MVGDAPSQWLTADLMSLQIADQFTIWVMYRPPSPDGNTTSAYVPLACADWDWSATLTKGPSV